MWQSLIIITPKIQQRYIHKFISKLRHAPNRTCSRCKGYFHSTRLMQALRMGLLRLRQNRALGGLLLALLPCFLLLAYCCRFFCANAPTGMVEVAGAGRAGGAGGATGAGARAGAGAGVEAGGASGVEGAGSGVGPLALMVRAWLCEKHPAAWICQCRQGS